MPAQPKTTIAGKLNAARLAISNTRSDAELHALVAAYGYTDDKLQEGDMLYNAAAAAVKAHTIAVGTRREAALWADGTGKRARASYQALAQVARAVFARNTAQRTKLGLIGKAPPTTAAFLKAAYILFDNALNITSIGQALAGYGYDAARLSSERAMIAAFDQANQAQIAAIGAAQQATRDQRAALAALNQWLAQYLKIAQVAVRSKPDLLEKLGGLARSSRTPAQRGAPEKAAATRAAKAGQVDPL
jgi:hypothetical protein